MSVVNDEQASSRRYRSASREVDFEVEGEDGFVVVVGIDVVVVVGAFARVVCVGGDCDVFVFAFHVAVEIVA